MKKYSLSILAFIVLSMSLFAQGRGTIRGLVRDSESGEVLPYCNILVQELNKGASTDSRGYFILTGIPAQRYYTIIISYIGHESQTLDVFVAPNKITNIDINLSAKSYQLDTVEKVAEKGVNEKSTNVSLERIKIRDIEIRPKGVETDILRSLQYYSGVQSSSDISARYNVRGGATNQNLVLYNGATIYSPFHALGLFSVVDPEIINSVEFYKGGFPTEYGGRLSSVLAMNSKEGNKYKFGGKASSSYLSGKLLAEGPIPDGSFIISARKSYSNQILKKFLNDKNAPVDFYDLAFNLNYLNPDIVKGRKFTVYGFASGDNIDNPDVTKEDFKWSNSVLGLKWFQMVTDSPLYYEFNVSWSSFNGEVNPNASAARARENEIRDLTLRSDFNYLQDNKDEVGAGLEIKEIRSKLLFENKRGAMVDLGTYGVSIVFFAKYKLFRFDNFGLEAGTRFNVTRLAKGTAGEGFFEPRLNMNYRFSPLLNVKASWGIYNQEFTTITNENEVLTVFEPWIVTPNYLKPAKSNHYILGIESIISRFVDIEIEGYYKASNNISTINEQKYFFDDPDLIAAKGESYGIEFAGAFNDSPVRFDISYSLSWTFKEVNGIKYHPRYDSRHVLNLGMSYNFGSGWSASAVWKYSSGYPFTQVVGYYDKLYFSDLKDRLFNFIPYTILAGRNLERLPDYHRFDISISKQFTLAFMDFSLDVSLINVYDRNNIFYFERETGERVNMLPFLPTATLKVEI